MDKYIVFKTEDYHKALDVMGEGSSEAEVKLSHHILEDAVVIRKQDTFAPAGLFAYYNAIQTALEIVDSIEDREESEALAQRLHHLCGIRDYFFEQAQESNALTRKLPD